MYQWEESLFQPRFPHRLRVRGTSACLGFLRAPVGAIAAEEGAAAVGVWAYVSLPGFLPPRCAIPFSATGTPFADLKGSFSLSSEAE